MYKLHIEPVTETAQQISPPSTADVSDEKSQPEKKDVKNYPNYVIPPYNITPLMSFNDDSINKRLSIMRNALLSEHWNAYLDTKPPPARFQLYREMLNKSNNPLPRRFTLNGQFYDSHNRLCPIPNKPRYKIYQQSPIARKKN